MALLEAEERVHVSAAAAVVVRLANIVPVRKEPPWLLKKRDNFLRGKCMVSYLLVAISVSWRLKTKRRIPIFHFLNLVRLVCIIDADVFCVVGFGDHIRTK